MIPRLGILTQMAPSRHAGYFPNGEGLPCLRCRMLVDLDSVFVFLEHGVGEEVEFRVDSQP
jgi:hypothetical protein